MQKLVMSVPYETVLNPIAILALYVYTFCFARSIKFKNYNTNKAEIVEQDTLMPPNICGKLEDLVVGCVCCLVIFNFLIHFLK